MSAVLVSLNFRAHFSVHDTSKSTRLVSYQSRSDAPLAPPSTHFAGQAGEHSRVAEWIRALHENQGFYDSRYHAFVPVRGVTFLPAILSPDSQAIPFCKRFTRHFYTVTESARAHSYT